MLALSFDTRARWAALIGMLASPAVVIFVSSNVVNAGNLAFNMIFSRWMGPEMFGDLAVLLTIKLAVLGVLGALSSAVSQRIAGQGEEDRSTTERALARLNRFIFVALWFALPLIAYAVYAGQFHVTLDLGSPVLLLILLASLPYCAPLNILRGVALGRLDSAGIIASANVEMVVRLGGAVVAWHLGMGLEGVVAAIGLSIIAGWVVLTGRLPTPVRGVKVRPIATQLGVAAVPFATLQLAQVVILDGDIFLAKQYLTNSETGYVAALSLFQRIQFFACFALATVLLPSIVTATREGKSFATSLVTIGGLLAAVSIPLLVASVVMPAPLLSALVGPAYVDAAGYLPWVIGAAVLFTLNYLIATFLLAQSRQSGLVIVVAGAAIQIAAMVMVLSGPSGDLSAIIETKFTIQFITLGALVTAVFACTNTITSHERTSK